MLKYLETAGCAKNLWQHDTPLPSGFTPTCEDCAATDEECQELSTTFNLDFESCIASLIYLSMTRTDIFYAVNKLAKFTRWPGKLLFEALIYLLWYLRDNNLYGICFYSDISGSPIYQMLQNQNIQENHLLWTPLGMMTKTAEGAPDATSLLTWAAW